MWRGALTALSILSGSVAPAFAQSIPFKELEGAAIDAEMVQLQTFRTNGKVRTNENHTYLKLAFGPGDAIEQTLTVNILSTDGRQISTRSGTISYVLNKPREGRNGAIVWTYEGGSLTRTQAFLAGARRVSFSIARTDGKLTCAVTSAFAREDGVGEIETKSIVKPGETVQWLSFKQKSANCRIAKP